MSEPMEDISKSNYQTGAQEVNNVETVTDYLFIYLFTEKKMCPEHLNLFRHFGFCKHHKALLSFLFRALESLYLKE